MLYNFKNNDLKNLNVLIKAYQRYCCIPCYQQDKPIYLCANNTYLR